MPSGQPLQRHGGAHPWARHPLQREVDRFPPVSSTGDSSTSGRGGPTALPVEQAHAAQDLTRAAAQRPAHWQRVAAHQASRAAVHRLAGALVQRREGLLAALTRR
ncbi:hypothetical protein SAMN05660642_03986 [Geodermatophilus siccatus]|uniref:Uncharacterized protein n=1 Tax=Geodermatophilus siccatus TaxID=1137991 RepID=A0A1G9YCA1_9ACTN|nr:hypothetical protein SAMN05660642_03986 [Geodermatophilus siccatus]